jgi:pSer/pThr/pTyr-binding forkhead associated (FHA) protein
VYARYGVGEAFVYDLKSSNGTFINRQRLPPQQHVPIEPNDQLRFGESTRTYVFQPTLPTAAVTVTIKDYKKMLQQVLEEHGTRVKYEVNQSKENGQTTYTATYTTMSTPN